MRVKVALSDWEGDENAPNFVGRLEEAAESLRELAAPRPGGDLTKSAIDRAAKLAGLPYWRAFDLWYRKARRIEVFEQDAIGVALNKKRRLDARTEFHDLHVRMAQLEARLAQIDPEFHRETINQLRRGG